MRNNHRKTCQGPTGLLLLCFIASAALKLQLAAGHGPHQMPMPATHLMSGELLDPNCVDKYINDLVLPPRMPKVKSGDGYCDGRRTKVDEYEISVRQITQRVLPASSTASSGTCADYPQNSRTTVFAYGTTAGGAPTHNWPAFTIEATRNVPVKVKWVNELYDNNRNFLPHLFAKEIDQTIHWANPAALGGMIDMSPCEACAMNNNCTLDADCVQAATTNYSGPVPIVTHVHGSENAFDFSDGYSEAWFMPNTRSLPSTFAKVGTWYDNFMRASKRLFPSDRWRRGSAVFNYRNTQRPTQLWYHDHVIGITRLNVYAGMAGLYQLRSKALESGPELRGLLPYPPPGTLVGNGRYKNPVENSKVREIPLAIQDRVFNKQGQLAYPVAQPNTEMLPNGEVPPKWIPEFSASLDGQPVGQGGVSAAMMIVNGRTWPKQTVVREPYRLRLLNGCNARTMVVYFSTTPPTEESLVIPADQRIPFYVIGNEAGFLPSVVTTSQVLMGPAERYDIIFDFSKVPAGATAVYLLNEGPETPYDGSNNADALTVHTAQIMRFDVAATGQSGKVVDAAYLAQLNNELKKEYPANLGSPARTRKLTLVERNSASGNNVVQLTLGQSEAGTAVPKLWADPVTTNPETSTIEDWQLINLTPDAHPIHVHEAFFQVVSRTLIDVVDAFPPSFTETNAPVDSSVVTKEAILQAPCGATTCPLYKDTVLVPPGSITTIRLKTAAKPGLFQWHCHLLEHEDNEMMRPWCVGQPNYINPMTKQLMCPGPPGPAPLRKA